MGRFSLASFDEEQEEILSKIAGLRRKNTYRGQWNKFLGDVTNRIIIHYLNGHLPYKFVARGPGVYIEDVARELDIIVVDKDAEANELTNAYQKKDVHLVVEVKTTGVFYKKVEASYIMRKKLQGFLNELGGIPMLYLTAHESERMSWETVEAYGEKAFFLELGVRGGKRINKGEWKRFVEMALQKLPRFHKNYKNKG